MWQSCLLMHVPGPEKTELPCHATGLMAEYFSTRSAWTFPRIVLVKENYNVHNDRFLQKHYPDKKFKLFLMFWELLNVLSSRPRKCASEIVRFGGKTLNRTSARSLMLRKCFEHDLWSKELHYAVDRYSSFGSMSSPVSFRSLPGLHFISIFSDSTEKKPVVGHFCIRLRIRSGRAYTLWRKIGVICWGCTVI